MNIIKIILISVCVALVLCTLFVLKRSRISTNPIQPATFISLSDAVRAGDVQEAKRLVAIGQSLYEKADGTVYPLLFVAAYKGHLEMVQCLVECGADIHEQLSLDGCTALHCAADQGRVSVVRYLLNCGVGVNVYDHNGDTALLFTANDEIIKMLIDHGADINASSKESTVLTNAVAQDNSDRVLYLLEHGANPCEVSGCGITPLHYAATMDTPNTTEIILLLLHHGAVIDEVAYGVEYGTPLAFAARNNNLKIALLLLSQGADVNKTDDTLGESPLHAAAKYGHIDMINYLIRYGAKIHQKDANGLTSIDYAAKHNIVI